MYAVSLGNRDELLDVTAAISERRADFLDLGELSVFQRKAMRGERVVWILDEAAPELRMLDRPPDDRTDHLIPHVDLHRVREQEMDRD